MIKFVHRLSIKYATTKFQKWPKQFKEGCQEWRKACIDVGFSPQKFNSLL
jgi:hypothetical protein